MFGILICFDRLDLLVEELPVTAACCWFLPYVYIRVRTPPDTTDGGLMFYVVIELRMNTEIITNQPTNQPEIMGFLPHGLWC